VRSVLSVAFVMRLEPFATGYAEYTEEKAILLGALWALCGKIIELDDP